MNPTRFREIAWLAIFLVSCLTAQPGPLVIKTSSLPNATVGTLYSLTLSASGGAAPYTWSASGLPPGINISSGGVLGGAPSANTAGTFQVNLTVRDAAQATATAQLSLIVNPPLTIVTASPLPSGIVGTSYSLLFTGSGGTKPYTFSVGASPFGGGAPPAGLSLKPDGTLSGVPTVAGKATFIVVLNDSGGSLTSVPFTITITPQLFISTSNPLPTGVAGTGYSQTIHASGGVAPYRFSVSSGSLPSGLTLTPAGLLTGTPASAGSASFTIQVTDKAQVTAVMPFQLTVANAPQPLQVSPQQLTFSGVSGGDAAPLQAIAILAAQPSVGFIAQIVGGAASAPWLNIGLTIGPAQVQANGAAPGILTVRADPGAMAANTYHAVIQIQLADGTAQTQVAVSFTVSSAVAQLEAAPAVLRFGARAGVPGIQEQAILLRNAGGGTFGFLTSVRARSSWITAVTPTGLIGPNASALVRVTVNAQGLAAGSYHDIVDVAPPPGSPAGSASIPVSLFVSDHGAILGLNMTALRFTAHTAAGPARAQSVNVLNLGDTASLNWSADLLSGSDWLSIGSPSGTASPAAPGILKLNPNAADFPAGEKYALVRVSAAGALNSPQYLAAMLDVAPAFTSPLPDPSPAGLFFTNSTGAQVIQIFTNSPAAAAFQAAASTNDGANWLKLNSTSGTASTQTPGQLTASVDRTVIGPGIYTGSINIAMSGVVRGVGVTLVVAPPACSPSRLSIAETGLSENFEAPSGAPASLIVQLNDNCGNPVANGSVLARFSNGDPPLTLIGDRVSNSYSAAWQPGAVDSSMAIPIHASSPSLQDSTQVLSGAVLQNDSPPPSLVDNGILNIVFDGPTRDQLGGALAPGTVVQVYGRGLAPALDSPPNVPLLNKIDGTFLLIGPQQVPLYFVADSVLAAQLPFELTPNRQYSAILSANGALTLPQTVDVVPLQPGIEPLPGTYNAIAQHLVPSVQLVTNTNPAKPGEYVVIYLIGMGSTDPSVKSGEPTPAQYVLSTTQPMVFLDNQSASIQYAGLTPTGIGLYQINFQVPNNVRAGNLDLVVIQGGVASNTLKLPVSGP